MNFIEVLPPPAGYIPIRTPARKLTATPTPMAGQNTPAGFFMQKEEVGQSKYLENQPKDLPFLKPEDAQYFDKLLQDVDEDSLPQEEQKEIKIMRLLLKIKNGTPPMRKSALRQITDKAREFGAGPLFNQILPLLMSPTLEDQERHLLVKVSLDKFL
jgi:splicing factor 3B subunit 1